MDAPEILLDHNAHALLVFKQGRAWLHAIALRSIDVARKQEDASRNQTPQHGCAVSSRRPTTAGAAGLAHGRQC